MPSSFIRPGPAGFLTHDVRKRRLKMLPKILLADHEGRASRSGATALPKRAALAFVALCFAAATWVPAAGASNPVDLDARSTVSSLTVPGGSFFPESIAATPAGTLFVGSVVTGEILRFPHNSTTAETFVPAGV